MKGRIRREDLDEIRRKANIADVAAEHMKLRKAGRLFKALCPFHTEKTPSFSIDPAKGLYYCFGCGKGGDVFTLLQELESLSFAEAADRLARRFGVNVQYERVSPAERAAAGKRGRLIDAHRAAIELYGQTLFGEEGREAAAYLKGRGFARETVERFQVGFAPRRRDALVRHLLAAGFRAPELVEAGLAVQREDGGLVDRFRGRIVFPVFDLTGNPVAFGARRMGEGEGPKYLNSPESPIYRKGSVLYALERAKSDIVRTGRALVVEGYTDVMALHQAGVTEVVATCGTALGLDHFRLLRRFTDRAVLALDADDAGQSAAERAFETAAQFAEEVGLEARLLLIPEGKDPADYVGEAGGEAFRALAERSVLLLEHRLLREVARHVPRRGEGFGPAEPERAARALHAAIPILALAGDEVVRGEYARRLAGWLRIDEGVVFGRLESTLRSRAVNVRSEMRRIAPHVVKEREAIKLALQYRAEIEPRLAELKVEDFSTATHRAIWAEILAGNEDPASIGEALPDPRGRKLVTELAMEPPEGVEPGADELPPRLAQEIFARLKEFSLGRQIEEVKGNLQRLNPVTDAEEYESLARELFALEGSKRRMAMALQEGVP